jgi:hypothetical protein
VSPSNDDVVQRKSGVWTNRSVAQFISDLGGLGTTFQPLDSDLTAIAALSPSNDDVVQRKSGVWTKRTMAQLMADLGALGQIPFPATQNASSDPNTLDDYEEGTFTPTLTAATTPPTGVAYITQSGGYTKIGNLVSVWFFMALSSKGTGGAGIARLGGLPFVVGDPGTANQFGAGGRFWNISYPAGTTQLSLAAVRSTSEYSIAASGSGVASASVQWSDFVDASQVAGSLTYST